VKVKGVISIITIMIIIHMPEDLTDSMAIISILTGEILSIPAGDFLQ
jgi:hypothetical protein